MGEGPRAIIRVGLAAASLMAAVPAFAASTPPSSSAEQPSLPPPSPVVQSTLGEGKQPAAARKTGRRHAKAHRHVARRVIEPVPPYLERPAVAGVALLVPLPRPPEPPHIVVPLPEYPLDSIATLFTTPPPPIVCHRTPREPGLPDPEFYRERTVRCAPDNP